jgi:NADPH:quinone reductase-like Zn-dependent oxidoreductase
MMCLNSELSVPWLDGKDDDKGRTDTPILIYSGATSAGLYAIQMAKKAGVKVITTASPRSTELVKEYGADDVFDYNSPTAAGETAKKYPTLD